MPLGPSKATRLHSFTAVRLCAPAALLLASLGLAPLTLCAPPQGVSPERALFDAANRERVAVGLPLLRWDESLAAAARRHAERMAQNNALSHQFADEPSLEERARQAGVRFSVLAEDVAEGASAEVIHSGWMRSAPHRANLLARDLNSIGIAVVMGPGRTAGDALRGGTLFAVEDFSLSVASLSLEQQERQVSAQLAALGLQVGSSVGEAAANDARKACEGASRFAESRPSLVVRFETPDLSRLPEGLGQKVRGGQYRAAAVGACSPGDAGGFTHFRIAVLLF